MKILQINGVIHQGSTGEIVDSINSYLDVKNIEHKTCYGIGKKCLDGFKFCYRFEQALYRRCSMITGFRYGFAPISTKKVINYIEKYNPDIVHLHSINGNCINLYKLIKYLKETNRITIITNHAEFFYTGNCTSTYGCKQYMTGCIECPHKIWASDYALFPKTHKAWIKMKNTFKGFTRGYMVSVSDYIKQSAESSPLVEDLHHVRILNGINIMTFKPTYTIDIKTQYNIGIDKKICVFVTSEFSKDKEHLKGGYWLLKVAKDMKKMNYHFLVVGNSNEDEKAYDNISFIGRVYDKEILANIYSQADVALSFSKSESFGMTCSEALCCGTPVAGFKCGGMESIALSEYSRFCDYGDIKSFINNIIELTDIHKNESNIISNVSRETYSRERMAKQYFELYQEVINTDEDNRIN